MKSYFHILDSIDLTAEGTSREMCFGTMQFVQIWSAFSEFGSLFWVTIQHWMQKSGIGFFSKKSTREFHSELFIGSNKICFPYSTVTSCRVSWIRQLMLTLDEIHTVIYPKMHKDSIFFAFIFCQNDCNIQRMAFNLAIELGIAISFINGLAFLYLSFLTKPVTPVLMWTTSVWRLGFPTFSAVTRHTDFFWAFNIKCKRY